MVACFGARSPCEFEWGNYRCLRLSPVPAVRTLHAAITRRHVSPRFEQYTDGLEHLLMPLPKILIILAEHFRHVRYKALHQWIVDEQFIEGCSECGVPTNEQPERQLCPSSREKRDTSRVACHPCAGTMLIFSVSFQF